MGSQKTLVYIFELRKRFFKQSYQKEALLKLIGESEVAEQVYNSNAIENSTLTLEETDKILVQIELDRYISERELFETKNLARVVNYIDTKAKERELSNDIILVLHQMLMSNIKDEVAGRFRMEQEWVRVGSHIAADPVKVDSMMDDLMIYYHSAADENIIQKVARFHLTFESIHPFVDGNGRIGRVLNNYILIREGYVPINIKFIDRKKYYDAFKEFDEKGKTGIMENIVSNALTNSYHKRLAYLEGKNILKLSDYAKQSEYSLQNLLNKAKRQTIEAFTEKGLWKIGI